MVVVVRVVAGRKFKYEPVPRHLNVATGLFLFEKTFKLFFNKDLKFCFKNVFDPGGEFFFKKNSFSVFVSVLLYLPPTIYQNPFGVFPPPPRITSHSCTPPVVVQSIHEA